ncbi:PAS domain-containing protein [Sphingomonas sp. LR59]
MGVAGQPSTGSLDEDDEDARYAVALSPQINWTAAPDGSIERVSPRWAEMTGAEPSAALGDQWLKRLHPDDATDTAKAWRTSVRTKLPIDIEYRLKTCNAEYRWVRSRAVARLDNAGRVVRWYGTLEDVHDRKLAEQALRDSEERFRLAAQAAGLGIWDYNASHDRREWSDEFKAMLGLPIDATPSIDTALSCVVPDDRPKLLTLIGAVRAGHSGHRFETMVRIRRADTGAERWMKTAGWRIEAPLGRLHRVLVTVRDVTEERNVEDRIRWTAEHDGMTRLPNRTAFVGRLESAIATAARDHTHVALVLFDVDHLKETNDTIGHDAGDLLLQTLADRLTTFLASAVPSAGLAATNSPSFSNEPTRIPSSSRSRPRSMRSVSPLPMKGASSIARLRRADRCTPRMAPAPQICSRPPTSRYTRGRSATVVGFCPSERRCAPTSRDGPR